MKTIAITGSSGFVGKALIEKLKNRDDINIIEIDLETGYDITNQQSLRNVKEFDVMVHLAAKSYVPDSFEQPASFYHTNIIGTLNVLELCRKFDARIIYTSSYVYGNPEYLPIDENHPLKAFNPYAQSKLIGEELCQAYYRDFNVQAIIFRPFNIYGKEQGGHFLIQTIISQAKTGVVRLKDSRPKRDYIYIDDVARAYLKAIYLNMNGVEVFNLGSGVSTSIKELTVVISKYFKDTLSIHFTEERRKNEVLETIADISKVQKILNWIPSISLEQGVLLMLNN